MNLANSHVLIIGAGLSGISAAKLLIKIPAAGVILYDSNETLDKSEILKKLPKSDCIQLIFGKLPPEVTDATDLAVLSPGVPTDLPVVNELRRKNVRIWGEVELAWECGSGDVLAVTGTNGKTTVTSLLGEIMKNYVAHLSDEGQIFKDNVFVVGNIGSPYTDSSDMMTKDSITVAEISSFQLETIENFAPKVSAILNITPDHMNRHHTMEEYIRVKEKITMNQDSDDFCILNYDDEVLREFGKTIKPKTVYFSSRHKLNTGIYLDNDRIILAEENGENLICKTQELKILGMHNYENVMAAAAMAHAYGVSAGVIRESVTEFCAVEHRIEFVTEKHGVVYYNDSKGTNTDAAIKGIEAMDRPTLLIGGGYDKDSTYDDWIRSFDGKVRYLVLIGQTKEKIAAAARRCGFENIIIKDTLEEAVDFCAENARKGDAVLLSPACASWDMFSNYEERGRKFKELVNHLK